MSGGSEGLGGMDSGGHGRHRGLGAEQSESHDLEVSPHDDAAFGQPGGFEFSLLEGSPGQGGGFEFSSLEGSPGQGGGFEFSSLEGSLSDQGGGFEFSSLEDTGAGEKSEVESSEPADRSETAGGGSNVDEEPSEGETAAVGASETGTRGAVDDAIQKPTDDGFVAPLLVSGRAPEDGATAPEWLLGWLANAIVSYSGSGRAGEQATGLTGGAEAPEPSEYQATPDRHRDERQAPHTLDDPAREVLTRALAEWLQDAPNDAVADAVRDLRQRLFRDASSGDVSTALVGALAAWVREAPPDDQRTSLASALLDWIRQAALSGPRPEGQARSDSASEHQRRGSAGALNPEGHDREGGSFDRGHDATEALNRVAAPESATNPVAEHQPAGASTEQDRQILPGGATRQASAGGAVVLKHRDGMSERRAPDGTTSATRPGVTVTVHPIRRQIAQGGPGGTGGFIVVESPDGNAEIKRSPAGVVVTAKDQSVITASPDGQVTVQALTGIHEIRRDGSSSVTGPDGPTVTTAADGSYTVERHLADGTSIIEHSDGTREVGIPDGSRFVWHSDGKTETILPAGAHFALVYRDGTTFPPGIQWPSPPLFPTGPAGGDTQSYKDADGNDWLISSDGTHQTIWNDKATWTRDRHGNITVEDRVSETKWFIGANGSSRATDSDGNVILRIDADGKRWVLDRESGSMQFAGRPHLKLTSPDGQTTVEEINGNLFKSSFNGRWIDYHSDGTWEAKSEREFDSAVYNSRRLQTIAETPDHPGQQALAYTGALLQFTEDVSTLALKAAKTAAEWGAFGALGVAAAAVMDLSEANSLGEAGVILADLVMPGPPVTKHAPTPGAGAVPIDPPSGTTADNLIPGQTGHVAAQDGPPPHPSGGDARNAAPANPPGAGNAPPPEGPGGGTGDGASSSRRDNDGSASGSPESERGSIAGAVAERIWSEQLVMTERNTKNTFTVQYTDVLTGKQMVVNVRPDFMPTRQLNADGKFKTADRPGDALIIADSKYTWNDTKKVQQKKQIQAMLHLAKDNGVPFAFLVKEGGDIAPGIRRYADQLGVDLHVIRDPTGRIR